MAIARHVARRRVRHASFVLYLATNIVSAGMFGCASQGPTQQEQLGKGMTWVVIEQRDAVVHVGADAQTDPYLGDETSDRSRRLLCIQIDGRLPPAGMTFDFYNGWSKGLLKATAPMQGATLTSREVADAICAQNFGQRYRMAEFHDGQSGAQLDISGGWSYWGEGTLGLGTRVWVAISDQPANPWNSAR